MSDEIFPTYVGNTSGSPDFNPSGGITKRELFAAMAMQGILSGWPDTIKLNIGERPIDGIAIVAFKVADAMLSAIEKETVE